MSDLTGKRRPNSIAFPRQIAMYLSRRLTECSLKDIDPGLWRPGPRHRDPCQQADCSMEEDVRVRDIVLRLEEDLKLIFLPGSPSPVMLEQPLFLFSMCCFSSGGGVSAAQGDKLETGAVWIRITLVPIDSMIHADQLSKEFGRFQAVKNTSFRLKRKS